MHMLTWHGAIVRRAPAHATKDSERGPSRSRLMQEPVWLTTADSLDFDLDTIPALDERLIVEPAETPGTIHIQQDGFYLSAAPSRRELTFDAAERLSWETFLLLEASDLADLRHILAHRWKLRPGSGIMEKSDIRLVQGFVLELGGIQVNLAGRLPLQSYARRRPVPRLTYEPAISRETDTAAQATPDYTPPASFVIQPGHELAEEITLADGSGAEGGYEMELRPRRAPKILPHAHTAEQFRGLRDCDFPLAGEPSFAYPPIVAGDTDRTMVSRFFQAVPDALHDNGGQLTLRRERKRHVLLAAGGEGTVFDRDGAENDRGLLQNTPLLPSGFAKRDGHVWVDMDVLGHAPKIAGTCLVFYDASLDDYAHFLLGSLAALDAMEQHASPGARLLLPPSISGAPSISAQPSISGAQAGNGFDHRTLMNLLGFGELPAVESMAPVVWTDDAIFPVFDLAAIPADRLRRLRARAQLDPPSQGGAAITEIQTRLLLSNGFPPTVLADLLVRGGFQAHDVAQLTLEQRIHLMQSAEFVIAADAKILTDILFCKPGTKILQILPGAVFDPTIWSLAHKLGLTYGVVGTYDEAGPDLEVLAKLVRMLGNYG